MRSKTLLFLLLSYFYTSAQNPATIFTIPSRNIVLPCGTTCTTITATIPHIKQTTSYIVESTPYLPFAYSTPAGIDVTTLIPSTFFDDWWTNKIPITFPFCYYGITYPTLLIGTNSAITFDTTRAGTGSGYTIALTGGGIPNTAYAPSMIFGPYHDIDIDNAGANKKIEYRVEGVAPKRRFIASYNNVPYFSASCNTFFATHQMVLYESTGVIEVYIRDKPSCTAWNNGLTILGIQDQTRTQAVSVPGRNATVWGANAMNEGWRYTPSGGTTRFKRAELVLNGSVVGTMDTTSVSPTSMNIKFNNVCPANDSSAYVLRVVYGQCNDPAQDVVFLDTVYVRKTTPVVNLSSTTANCTTGGTITMNVTGGVGTIRYNIDGGNFQTGNVFTGVGPGTHTVTVRDSLNCSITNQVTIPLNNNLTLAVNADTTICLGGSLQGSVQSNATSFAWSPAAAVSNPNTQNPTLTVNQNTMFTVVATLGSCSQTRTFNVNTFTGIQVSAGPDKTILVGDQVQLTGTSSTSASYLWTPPAGLSATNILNPIANPSTTTLYTLTATSPQGCRSQDDVLVTVLPYCVNPMEAFTPNGDGINDLWLVTTGNCLKGAKAEVFNRYGNIVFASDDYKNNWDGTYKGKPLPDGTYYFVLSYQLINGKPVFMRGNVTILR